MIKIEKTYIDPKKSPDQSVNTETESAYLRKLTVQQLNKIDYLVQEINKLSICKSPKE